MRAFDEMIHKPNDDTQNGWLAGFEYLLFKGHPLFPADTLEELRKKYENNAGLFVRCFLSSKVDAQRKMQALSLSEEWDTIDEREEQVLLRVEDCDLLHDPRLQELDPEQKEAVEFFILVWLAHEAGERLPGSVLTRLSRYRKKVGLPLVLR